jgi:hypothetical protein
LGILEVFSRAAKKYRDDHKMIPVLVVDNVNKLPGSLLAELQGYAKEAADDDIVKVIFVSSEGDIPHRMQGTSILSISYQ